MQLHVTAGISASIRGNISPYIYPWLLPSCLTIDTGPRPVSDVTRPDQQTEHPLQLANSLCHKGGHGNRQRLIHRLPHALQDVAVQWFNLFAYSITTWLPTLPPRCFDLATTLEFPLFGVWNLCDLVSVMFRVLISSINIYHVIRYIYFLYFDLFVLHFSPLYLLRNCVASTKHVKEQVTVCP